MIYKSNYVPNISARKEVVESTSTNLQNEFNYLNNDTDDHHHIWKIFLSSKQ